MHVGLIGGIGPAATDFYYRGLIQRHAEAGTVLDLTIAHADTRELVRNLGEGAAERQAQIFRPLVQRLARAGARFAAVTSMAGHFCINELMADSPLPILNAVPEVDAAIVRRGARTVGILGTRAVMQSGLYGGITSARVVHPEGAALDEVHDAYVDMAMSAHATEAHRHVFLAVGDRLCQAQGAELVVLGGTDLFLAFAGLASRFPVLDCAEAHIEAIYRQSVRIE